MTKLLCVSDPHYHNYKSHSETIGGKNSRLIDVDSAMCEAIAIGKDQDCKIMCVCGDIFHERGRIRPSVFNTAFHRIGHATSRDMKVVLGIGNHDMEDFKLGVTSIDMFEAIEGAYVMGGSEGYSQLDICGAKILGIQYCHKPDEFKETYERALRKHNPDVIMIHQGVDDFDGDIGMPKTSITTEYLQSLTSAWILTGHYHSPKISGRVINVGAPLQHSFGDEGSKRGCWVLDTELNTVEFFKIKSPEFKTIKDTNGLKSKKVNGCFVRVIAKTARAAAAIEKAVMAEGAKTITVQYDRDYQPAHEKTVAISSKPIKMISDFCKLVPKFTPHESKIVSLWEKICI